MILYFIRHGDPNYQIDGLTEKGKSEAIAHAYKQPLLVLQIPPKNLLRRSLSRWGELHQEIYHRFLHALLRHANLLIRICTTHS